MVHEQIHTLMLLAEILTGCLCGALAVITVRASRRGGMNEVYGAVTITAWTMGAFAAWMLATTHIPEIPQMLRFELLWTADVLGIAMIPLLTWGVVLDRTGRSRTG
jgi:hypothetical protein